ncbi:response regulator [Rhodoferax ferrireducens]|uniref:response regulator n=1 Tax=Rhodoferax ferrireducens TaxID=192843 RepID=UPI000E0D6D7E|nr:response regulator [Rhodoferax ferrireducens]
MPACILIIEDDGASRELVKYLLEASGYDTLDAADGSVGVRMALESKPDLVICDLQMPVMNGYEVVRCLQVHPEWCRVPMIAVTAFSMAGDRETALAAGFDEHITKPITPETFVEQIEAFLPPALRATRSPLN